MAIQPNKRKRKHEASVADQPDEAEVAVPKKVAKESHTPKTKKKKEAKTNAGAPEEMQEQSEEVQEAAKENQITPSKKEKRKKEKPEETAQEEENDEAEISPDSGIEPEEKTQKFPNDFKMMNFRNKLLGNNFITGESLHKIEVTIRFYQ